MKAQSILNKLKKTTKEAGLKTRQEHLKERKQSEVEKENELRKQAKNIFEKYVTEERLLAFAERGEYEYPLLLIDRTLNRGNRPVKNKKTGYRYSVGKIGEFLFDELVNNGFEPKLINIQRYKIENVHRVFNWTRNFDAKIVSEPGWYLGISWKA